MSGAGLHEPHAIWFERLQHAFDRGLLEDGEVFRGTSLPLPRERSSTINELAEAIKSLPPDEIDLVSTRLL